MADDLLDDSAYVYIEHVPSDINGQGVRLYIPEWPDQIAETIGSNFNSTNALSRPAPVYSYINTGPRSIQVSLTLHRDMMDDLNENKCNVKPEEDEDYVDMCIRYLETVVYPNYHVENKEVEPPKIAIRFGNELYCEGIVNGGITVTREKPILEGNKYAFVTIAFTVYEIEPQDAESIAKYGSNRPLTQTMQEIFAV